MKNLLLIAALAIAAGLSSCKKYPDTLPVTNYSEALLPANFTERLNKVFDSVCTVYNIKGASAAIALPNIGLWKRAYGMSHPGTPVNTDMVFSIGSNTKTFAAATILRLQEKGMLNIKDTIGKWFAGKKYINGKITIQQLLNHTSGLGYFDSSAAFLNLIINNNSRIFIENEFYELLVPPHFAPGERYEYCNTGYVLLGFIIQKVTNKPVKEVMRELIFTPAGLKHTFYFPYEPVIGTVPHFWSEGLTGTLEDLTVIYGYSPNGLHSLAGTAGCMMSTAADNTRFWYALFNGKIINQNSLELMKQFIKISGNQSYGLGLIKTEAFYSGIVYGHSGSVIGGSNDNLYDAARKIHISVHLNQDNIVEIPLILSALHKVTMQYQK